MSNFQSTNKPNAFSTFTPQGGGDPNTPVKLQEWTQFHGDLNQKLNLLFTLLSVFSFLSVPNQASLPVAPTKPTLAYEQDNGVLWYYNLVDKAWQKVGLVLS